MTQSAPSTTPRLQVPPADLHEHRTLRSWRRARRAARLAAPGPITLPTLDATTQTVQTSAGPIVARVTGEGPPILFVHGLLVDGRVWDATAALLAPHFRCVIPDLPLGAHRTAMDAGADLSPEGVARLLDEIVAGLDLHDVTVVANDTGGALTQLWMADGAARVARVVLATVDAFDNFPPPGFGIYLVLGRWPRLLRGVLAASRWRAVRSAPIAYGLITHRPIDDGLLQSWLAPARADEAIRRDLASFLGTVERDVLLRAEPRLRRFDRPVLLAWAGEQRWFPIEHAHRLAALLPDGRVEEIAASGALPQLDRPDRLGELVREFVALR